MIQLSSSYLQLVVSFVIGAASSTGLTTLIQQLYRPISYPFGNNMESDQGLLGALASNITEAVLASEIGNGTTGGHGGPPAGHKRGKKHYWYMSRYSWILIGCVIAALLIINVFTRGVAYVVRRRHANKSANELFEKSEIVKRKSTLSRIPAAAVNLIQNVGNCTTVPTWFGGATVGEVMWNLGYGAALGAFSFHQSESFIPSSVSSGAVSLPLDHDSISTATPNLPGTWANQAGHMAYAQIPFIIGLAGKNNLISCTHAHNLFWFAFLPLVHAFVF